MIPIDLCWTQAKCYTRDNCHFNITGLRLHICLSLNTISPENIKNYFRYANIVMYGYLLGHKAELDLGQFLNIKKGSNLIAVILQLMHDTVYIFIVFYTSRYCLFLCFYYVFKGRTIPSLCSYVYIP